MGNKKKIAVLFVCLGNICRSPVAQAVFEHQVQKEGLDYYITADSAGTAAYHVGEKADSRMRRTAKIHGVEITHRARKFCKEDFDRFDLILAMDASNFENILDLASNNKKRIKVKMFRQYDPECGEDKNVPDPYYGGSEGFELVYNIVERTGLEILKFLQS